MFAGNAVSGHDWEIVQQFTLEIMLLIQLPDGLANSTAIEWRHQSLG